MEKCVQDFLTTAPVGCKFTTTTAHYKLVSRTGDGMQIETLVETVWRRVAVFNVTGKFQEILKN